MNIPGEWKLIHKFMELPPKTQQRIVAEAEAEYFRKKEEAEYFDRYPDEYHIRQIILKKTKQEK